MPNLIELQLKGWSLRKLKLQNTIGIRYLELPYIFFKNNGDFINVVNNTPNIIQLTIEKYWVLQFKVFLMLLNWLTT